jgi:type IV pilus assembly protein PilQ
MRLKQLLSVGLAVPLFTAFATADSQLTAVSVQARGDAATVIIRANGTFTHNEYRPVNNLLLVDFPGSTIGALDTTAHSVNVSGVRSYQVHSYKAANGSDIARVELTLDPHASLHFSTEKNALMIAVSTGTNSGLSAAPAANTATHTVAAIAQPATTTAQSKPAPALNTTHAQLVQVRGVTVVRGHDGTDVEIHASGVLSPKTLTLKSPDRLVIDLPNSVLESRAHDIPVNAADLNMVRMARYQSDPPTTRVVLDLKAPQNFQLASTTDKLIVKLHPFTAATASPASTPATVATAAKTDVPTAAPSPTPSGANAVTNGASAKPVAQDYVVLEPNYHTVAAATQASQDKPASERAADAAKVLGATAPVEIPLSAVPAEAAIKPEAVKAAMMQAASQPSSSGAQAVNAASSTANCNTGRYTGEPISVNLKDVDLKDFFRLIHEISGLNVVLDPGINGTLTIVLDDVPWDQALAIVLQNNALQCQLSGNVLRIALPDTLRKEAEAVRATEEAQALAIDRVTVTRYLSYASAKNVVPTLKTFLSKRGNIISDDRTNSIIVQDIPSVIPGLDRLVKELDRKTPQVEIEARVVAATRSFARDLGSQLGFGWGNRASAVGGAGAVGTSPLTTGYFGPPPYFTIPAITTTGGGATSAAIPLFSNLPAIGPTSGLSFLNSGAAYRIDTIITAAESRGLLKILSRPRVITQNNVQALVRQGVRIPVVTAAQLGGPPTTTYVDAFLRLQVQPQITAEGTIFLNVDVENTTPNFSVNVNGNPELVTQQATTQVLVADGGTVVIGGVIQTNDSISTSQVPFLGDVPLLGNLFKHKSVSTSTQELIFFITPRIIQAQS